MHGPLRHPLDSMGLANGVQRKLATRLKRMESYTSSGLWISMAVDRRSHLQRSRRGWLSVIDRRSTIIFSYQVTINTGLRDQISTGRRQPLVESEWTLRLASWYVWFGQGSDVQVLSAPKSLCQECSDLPRLLSPCSPEDRNERVENGYHIHLFVRLNRYQGRETFRARVRERLVTLITVHRTGSSLKNTLLRMSRQLTDM